MTAPALAPDATGEFAAVWSPTDTGSWRAVDATEAQRATVHVFDLRHLDRDPERPDDIVIVGDARYLIGRMHERLPFRRYLHRLNP